MRPLRWVRISAVVFLALALSLVMQRYVGGNTIYSDDLEQKRAAVHEAILHNAAPPGESWHAVGGNGINTRVATVYAAEAIRVGLRLSLPKSYLLLETSALFAALLAVFAFLLSGSGAHLAIVGLLYVAAIQPLTYAFHYFHPWDRPSLLAWILVAWYIRKDKPLWAAALLPLAVLIKWDIVVLPVLYVLAYVRRDNLARVGRAVAAMGAAAVGTYLIARWLWPQEATPTLSSLSGSLVPEQVLKNVRDARLLGPFFPPLLAVLLPVLLAIAGWRRGTRFEIASFTFGAALLVPLFLLTNFQELRAEMPALFLMLPLALRGVESLLPSARPAAASSSAAPS